MSNQNTKSTVQVLSINALLVNGYGMLNWFEILQHYDCFNLIEMNLNEDWNILPQKDNSSKGDQRYLDALLF